MRRQAAPILCLALVIGLASAGAAHAEKSFTFYGSGWGHGVGMSQWGAYGLALKGWNHQRILEHYYTGTNVAPAPWKPARIRVGLLQGQGDIHIKAQATKLELRLGAPNGKLVGSVPKGRTWTVDVKFGKYNVLNASGGRVGGKLWGSTRKHLFARYMPLGSSAFIAETGHTYNRGWLEFNIYGSCASCKELLRLVASVPREQYLFGVAEVPSSWPAAALRVQAVAARTYAFEKVKRLGQHRPTCNCGVNATVSDQVYVGWTKEGGAYGERWVQAVGATAGQVVLYGGALIQAYFMSSSGGYTEDVANVWGSSVPYLKAVCDPGVSAAPPASSFEAWTRGPYTTAYVTSRLKPYTGEIGPVQSFSAVRGDSGRIVTITARGTQSRSAVVQDHEFKAAFDLLDVRVWINENLNVRGAIRDSYDALGCAPGLPLTGEAPVPGGHRQRFSNGALYHNHLRSSVRWIHGPIYTKYVSFGQVSSVLGLPRTGIVAVPGGGARARFEGGYIYRSPGTGAHALFGHVLTYYLGHGSASGSLGFPTSDVTNAGGSTWATFEGGTITCDADGDCSQS
jgi:SpoIID/LytB domain protein